MNILRFACAVGAAAIFVPCAGGAIQHSIISIGNGHGLNLLTAMATGVSMLPLALLAAPIYVVGATLLGAFSLGLESLIRRKSVLIWLLHGLAIGFINLIALHPYDRSDLIVNGVVGSWLFGGLAMWSVLSARWTATEPSET